MTAIPYIIIAIPIILCAWIWRSMRSSCTSPTRRRTQHTGEQGAATLNPKKLFAQVAKIVTPQNTEDAELLKAAIKIHCEFRDSSWDHLRDRWKSEPATEMQLAYLMRLGYTGPTNINKRTASELIDQYLIAEQYRTMARDRAAAAARQERERRKEAERQERAAQKRRADLEKKNNTPPRARILHTTRAKWLYDFSALWDRILADGSISIEEAEDLKAWLNSHRTVSCMHEDFIAAIDRAAQDGIITGEESQDLYQGAIRLIETLRGTPEET